VRGPVGDPPSPLLYVADGTFSARGMQICQPWPSAGYPP
jgi:hypothetical protein